MNFIEKVSRFHPDVIDNFISSGSSSVIPLDIQQLIMQLMWSIEIYDKERNISRAARLLKTRVKASQNTIIDISTAKSRIYSALDYFNIDANVQNSVWLRDAADKFEDLAKVAVAAKKFSVAEKCFSKALECRLNAGEQENNRSLGVVYLLSSELTPEHLGFVSKNKKEIAKKSNDGFYLNLINSLDIDKGQRVSLIEDAEIEIIE